MLLVFIAALLQAGVVKPAMRFERDPDRARLVGVWLQAVFERAKHNLIIMFLPCLCKVRQERKVEESAFPCRLKATVPCA